MAGGASRWPGEPADQPRSLPENGRKAWRQAAQNRSAARSARRSPAQNPGGRRRRSRRRARRTSWSCCSTMSASPISAATARRSRRRPSTGSPAAGLRYSGFHTTAMCSTTRAALLTGRNHHSVGVGCLANFDSRLSRLSRQDRARGRHARRDAAAARLSQLHARQMACHAADRERRHRPVRRLAARPRLRPLLRLHGCRDRPVRARAGARQHAISIRPAPIAERLSPDRPIWSTSRSASSPITSPTGPIMPWLTWLALGACHAPHQAPLDIIKNYDAMFAARLGRRARAAPGAAEGDGPRAAGHAPAAAQ